MKVIKRIQRNHALEHATVHILSSLQPGLRLVGRTDYRGFWLYGSVATSLVHQAVIDGLARLQNDERWLAVHPKCGTNIAVAALVGSAAFYAAKGLTGHPNAPGETQRPTLGLWLSRAFVSAIGLGSALALAQPLGILAQQYVTTADDLEGASVRSITRRDLGGLIAHRVLLAHER